MRVVATVLDREALTICYVQHSRYYNAGYLVSRGGEGLLLVKLVPGEMLQALVKGRHCKGRCCSSVCLCGSCSHNWGHSREPLFGHLCPQPQSRAH